MGVVVGVNPDDGDERLGGDDDVGLGNVVDNVNVVKIVVVVVNLASLL
jgi:hypothetical protein